jgi:hypothetical protein
MHVFSKIPRGPNVYSRLFRLTECPCLHLAKSERKQIDPQLESKGLGLLQPCRLRPGGMVWILEDPTIYALWSLHCRLRGYATKFVRRSQRATNGMCEVRAFDGLVGQRTSSSCA